MLYAIKYEADVERQVLALPADRRAKLFEAMSHLVENPYPDDAIRSENTVKWRATNYLEVTYLVSERLVMVIVVVEIHDTLPYYKSE